MSKCIKSGKEVLRHVREGWELWHISKDALPGHWELRRGRETKGVHWDAIDLICRHYLAEMDELTIETKEGRYIWSYIPK